MSTWIGTLKRMIVMSLIFRKCDILIRKIEIEFDIFRPLSELLVDMHYPKFYSYVPMLSDFYVLG